MKQHASHSNTCTCVRPEIRKIIERHCFQEKIFFLFSPFLFLPYTNRSYLRPPRVPHSRAPLDYNADFADFEPERYLVIGQKSRAKTKLLRNNMHAIVIQKRK